MLRLLKDLQILSISDNFKFQVSSLMWDLDHDTLPSSLSSHFSKRSSEHSQHARLATAGKFSITKQIQRDTVSNLL